MPDPADTSSSVEEPEVKPADDGGAPAPTDGSTGGGHAADPMAPDAEEPAADRSTANAGSAGPPTDPGTGATG